MTTTVFTKIYNFARVAPSLIKETRRLKTNKKKKKEFEHKIVSFANDQNAGTTLLHSHDEFERGVSFSGEKKNIVCPM